MKTYVTFHGGDLILANFAYTEIIKGIEGKLPTDLKTYDLVFYVLSSAPAA